MSKRRLSRGGGIGLLIGVGALVPTIVTDPVWQGIAVQVLINGCVAIGLTVLFGFAGQISLAPAAFMGIGAFAPAILAVKHGWSPWWGLPVGIAIAIVIAVVVGFPVLRLEGLYLAMATTALNIMMVLIAQQVESVTGGPFGLAGLVPLDFFGWSLVGAERLYYFVLASFLILFLLSHRLINSPVGTMYAALRHDPRAAALTGVPVHMLKVKAFVLSAAFAAVGGFFLAEYLLIASPDSFNIFPSLYVLLMVVVGGTRSLPGALLGAAYVTIVPQLIPAYPREQQILFAASFVLIVVYFPDGIAGAVSSVLHFVRRGWQAMFQSKELRRTPV